MPLYEPYEEDPDDVFDYQTDWEEEIPLGSDQPGGGVALTNGAQDGILVGFVPWNKQRSAARYFLGFSWADSGPPYALHREVPAFHPKWPMMRCHGVALAGYTPKPDVVSTGDTKVWEESPWSGPAGEILRNTRYDLAKVTLRFRSFGRMRFLPDELVSGDYTQEYKRFVSFGTAAAVETLQAENASILAFKEGAPLNEPFPAPLAQLLAKANFTITWLNVPHEYLSADPDILIPTKQTARLGTWNATPFLGFSTGTMLFLVLECEEVLFPVATLDPSYQVVTGWNVKMHFQFTDPPKGVTSSGYRGHRVFPWRNPNNPASNGKWFFAALPSWTSGSDVGADELVPGSDLWKLFQHVSDPS